jgi:hypothetical protein
VIGTIAADPLDIVGLTTLMGVSAGASEIAVALIDGPVAANHPDLTTENICSPLCCKKSINHNTWYSRPSHVAPHPVGPTIFATERSSLVI